ncbi:transcriptional regulator, BadM/Rrf2 family [Sphingomonas palmae]|uniref:Transcriptional regulator, BadM/Rrf2 family n=1 Tax=Sphingomonas palmae TaxID=1855283 RepID=A0A1H7J1P9_9SPHN|nr:Rrf2 family transcriptional regulator [Sphingomonas palmae]SEK68354.1 transcriptional regulator, BadM/Rrf2 family [Sphingomonas palmae]
MDARLSRMLHLLIHMGRRDGPLTSEAAAVMLGTNPVVVRRTMAGLREAGYVRSTKGHGGGWMLTRGLDQLTMLDVYRALGEQRVFALGPADPAPACLVEQAVNESLGGALREAEALLIRRLSEVSLADIATDFEQRLAAMPGIVAAAERHI